jgi:hypothetical protein
MRSWSSSSSWYSPNSLDTADMLAGGVAGRSVARLRARWVFIDLLLGGAVEGGRISCAQSLEELNFDI